MNNRNYRQNKKSLLEIAVIIFIFMIISLLYIKILFI